MGRAEVAGNCLYQSPTQSTGVPTRGVATISSDQGRSQECLPRALPCTVSNARQLVSLLRASVAPTEIPSKRRKWGCFFPFCRVRVGGSAWESNPAPPRGRGATDFEDREGHRAPFASESPLPRRMARLEGDAPSEVTAVPEAECPRRCNEARLGPRGERQAGQPVLPTGFRNPTLTFDQADFAGARTLLRFLDGEVNSLTFS